MSRLVKPKLRFQQWFLVHGAQLVSVRLRMSNSADRASNPADSGSVKHWGKAGAK